MRPILFRIGPVTLYSYSTLLNLGVLLGAVLFFRRGRRRGIPGPSLADTLLAAAFGALALGRAAYVGVHWDYYSLHPRLALRPGDGGLVWHGALAGGVLGATMMGRRRKVPLLTFLDSAAPGAAVVSALAWLACYAIGCAWGIPTYPEQELLWALSSDAPDLYGIWEPRVALQLLGALWSGLVFWAIWGLQRRVRQQGALFSIWLLFHSMGCLTLGFVRGDDWPLVVGWRVDQLLNLALIVVGVFGLLVAFVRGDDSQRHDTRQTSPRP